MIYEIINKGKGLITSLSPSNLLLLTTVSVKRTSELINDGIGEESYFVEDFELATVAKTGSYTDLTNVPGPVNSSLSGVLTAGNVANNSIILADFYTDLTNFQGLLLEASTGNTILSNNYGESLNTSGLFLRPASASIYSNSPYIPGNGVELELSATGLSANFYKNTGTGTQFMCVGGGVPTAPEHFTTKSYVDGLISSPSLQEVISVNKTADRVEFLYKKINGGQIRGAFVYLTGSTISMLDASKTYFYGGFDSFDNIVTKNIARVNEDGSLDESFVTGAGFNSAPFSGSNILTSLDGKLYIGGSFTNYNGTAANRIISLNDNGSINTGFIYGTGFNNLTSGMSFNLAKTSFYVSGSYSNYNGTPTNRIIKLNLDGTIDNSFDYGTGFDNATVGIFVDDDDSIFVSGYFNNYNGTAIPRLVKLQTNGAIDTSFVVGTSYNTIGTSDTNFIFRNTQGILISYGYFTAFNGTTANHIIALNNDGTVSTIYNFGTGFNGILSVLTELTNGKYLAEGTFSSYNGVLSSGIIMLNADFTVYKTFSQSYYNVIVGTNNNYAMTFVDDHEQLFNISDGIPLLNHTFGFDNVSGKAEYKISGLSDTTPDEILPKRLIEELIDSKVALSDSGKMFTHTASGDGMTQIFMVPHGLAAKPEMVMVTGNSMDSIYRNTGGVYSLPFFAYADATNIIISYQSYSYYGEAPEVGVNNLKWTIICK